VQADPFDDPMIPGLAANREDHIMEVHTRFDADRNELERFAD
jgi:hypothetical protein